MFSWFRRAFGAPRQDVFEQLLPLLVEAIPRAVASHDVPKPICAVRVYYYDTCASSTYLTLRTISAELRATLVAQHGWNAPYALWSSGEEERDGDIEFGWTLNSETAAHYPKVRPYCGHDVHEYAAYTDPRIVQLFAEVYSQLSEANDMTQYVQMLRSVCRTLNAKDWHQFGEVTDDFVIAPADGDQHFGGDEDYNDLIESVGKDRVDMLRDRGFLGPSKTEWSCLPDQRPE